jgi:hypothetical protein
VSIPTPEPGIYRGVPAATYHAWDAASNSRLGHLIPPSTPAHLKAYLDEPPKDKKVWKEGRALHACVLEPERYEREYFVADGCLGTTQKGASCRAAPTIAVRDGDARGAVCHNHVFGHSIDDELVLVSERDHEMAQRCRARIATHAMAGGFLKVPDAEYELSIVWDQPVIDPATGEVITVRCKARLDWYSQTFLGGLPMDLKGCRSADVFEFKSQAFYNGYLRQSVLYRLGLRALGLPAATFASIAVEKEPPYELMVYRLGDAATGPLPEPGEPAANVAAVVMSSLRLWAWCQKTGRYPGYPEVVQDLTTDEWAWSRMEHQTSQINDFLSRSAA